MDTAHIVEFTAQLLNTGDQLSNIVDDLIDALVENGTDEDEAEADILGALAGTVANRLLSVPPAEVTRATELITIAIQGVFEDLMRAQALAAQRN